MSHEKARRQLAKMQARVKLNPDKYLKVEMLINARTLHYLERAEDRGDLEPLPALFAQLAQGQITVDTAGAAITRDLALASQVAALTLEGAQTGDISVGDVAGGSIYHIYLGGPRDEHKQ